MITERNIIKNVTVKLPYTIEEFNVFEDWGENLQLKTSTEEEFSAMFI